MANYLGAVLQGMESGVRTGLDMYKTVQSEARAKRDEQYRSMRDVALDGQWQKTYDRQVGQDTLAQANDERDFKFRERVQTHSEEQAAADDAAAERRHRETLALTQRRMAAADARTGAKIQLANRKEIKSQVEALVGDGSAEGFTRVINAVNTDMNVHAFAVDQARGAGFNIPDDMVGRLQVMPAGEGRVMFAVKGDDGALQPYDPDGPGGERAVVLDSAQFMAAMGGKGGVQAAETATARDGANGNAAALSQAVAGKVGPLGEELEVRKQGLAQAQTQLDAVATERAQVESFLSQMPADVDASTLPRTRTGQPDTRGLTLPRDEQVVGPLPEDGGGPRGGGGVAKWPTYGEQALARREAIDGEMPALKASLADAGRGVDVTAQRIKAAPLQAKYLEKQWGQVESSIRTLPAGEQKAAYANSKAAFEKDPALAVLFPGDDLKTAGDKALKERVDLVDKVVAKLDPTTMVDGKVASLKGFKADITKTLLSMPAQVQMAQRDPSGQALGALIGAANTAAKMGKPEATLYILEATARGLPAEEGVNLMQDPALSKVKDPDVRFEMAMEALGLVASGDSTDNVAALGHVIQGR